MAALLDVNLLVALAWPNHVHHQAALGWFQRNQAAGWATCPLTESGFVRVSSNSASSRWPCNGVAGWRLWTGKSVALYLVAAMRPRFCALFSRSDRQARRS